MISTLATFSENHCHQLVRLVWAKKSSHNNCTFYKLDIMWYYLVPNNTGKYHIPNHTGNQVKCYYSQCGIVNDIYIGVLTHCVKYMSVYWWKMNNYFWLMIIICWSVNILRPLPDKSIGFNVIWFIDINLHYSTFTSIKYILIAVISIRGQEK